MDFSSKRQPHVRLAGKTKQEQTRNELLKAVKEERQARDAARKRVTAACCVQARWRGHVCRRHLRQMWMQQLLTSFSAAAADPNLQLLRDDVNDRLLPLLLAATAMPGSRAAAVLLATAAPLSDVIGGGYDTVALRCALALLLRSVASTSAAHNVMCSAACESASLLRMKWLVVLCCGLLGCSTAARDALLQAAAARLLRVLLDTTVWCSCGGTDTDALVHAALTLQRFTACSPILFRASQRVLSTNTQHGHSTTPTAQHASSMTSSSSASVTSSPCCALMTAATRVLCLAASEKSQHAEQWACLSGMWIQHVLCCAGLYNESEAVWKLLTSDDVVAATIAALHEFRSSCGEHAVQSNAAQHSAVLGAADAAWVLANLTAMLTGRAASMTESFAQRIAHHLPSAEKLHQHMQLVAWLVRLTLFGDSTADSSCMEAAVEGWAPLFERAYMHEAMDAGGRDGDTMLDAIVALHYPILCAGMGAMATPLSRSARRSLEWRSLNVLAFSPRMLPTLWHALALRLALPRGIPKEASSGWNIAALQGGIRGLKGEHAEALGLFCRVCCHLLLILDDDDMHAVQQPFSLDTLRAIAACLNTLVFRTYVPADAKDALSMAEIAAMAARPRTCLLARCGASLLRALYERDVRRTFCSPELWLAPYRATHISMPQPQILEEPSTVENNNGGSSGIAAAIQSRFRRIARDGDGADGGDGRSGAAFSGAAVVRALLQGNARVEDTPAAQHSPARGTTAQRSMPHHSTAQQRMVQQQQQSGASIEGNRPSSLAALLLAAPHCIPYNHRVDVLRALIAEDKVQNKWGLPPNEGGPNPVRVVVHRQRVMEDALSQLMRLGSAVKTRLIVTFINESGAQEMGLDYGGLMKELLEEVIKIAFNVEFGLFATTPDGLAFSSPNADKVEGGLVLLEFVGMMVGKALYEGILLDVPLAPFFVARLQRRLPQFDDLAALDADLHRSLLQVKRYGGDVDDLGLDFTVEEEVYGEHVTHQLRHRGANVAVTAENKLQYVYAVADWHLNKKLGPPADAFARGLSQVIPLTWLQLFSVREVNELLAGGDDGGIDVSDMRAHVQYSGGYTESSAPVKMFWKIMSDMTIDERKAVMKFVTSCSRAPLGGFRHLQPPFTIHRVPCDASVFASLGGADVAKLPSASTCFNMLKLPNYRRAATMRAKLLYAVKSGAGFELS